MYDHFQLQSHILFLSNLHFIPSSMCRHIISQRCRDCLILVPDRRIFRKRYRPPLLQIAAGRQGKGELREPIPSRPMMLCIPKMPTDASAGRRRQTREKRAARANPVPAGDAAQSEKKMPPDTNVQAALYGHHAGSCRSKMAFRRLTICWGHIVRFSGMKDRSSVS